MLSKNIYSIGTYTKTSNLISGYELMKKKIETAEAI